MRERLAACRHSLSLQQLNRTVARLCSPSTGAVLRCAPPERPHVSSFALICSACRFLFSFSTNSSFFTVPPRCVSYSCQFAACFAAAAACRFWRAALRSCCVRVSRGMSSGRRRGRWAGHEEQATVIEEVSFAPPVRSGVPHALSKKCRWQCDGRVYAAPQLRLASRRKGESNERNERTITTTRKVSFSSFFFSLSLSLTPVPSSARRACTCFTAPLCQSSALLILPPCGASRLECHHVCGCYFFGAGAERPSLPQGAFASSTQ